MPTRHPPLSPSLLALTALLCCAQGSDGPSAEKGGGDDGPRYATSFTRVTVDPATPASMTPRACCRWAMNEQPPIWVLSR